LQTCQDDAYLFILIFLFFFGTRHFANLSLSLGSFEQKLLTSCQGSPCLKAPFQFSSLIENASQHSLNKVTHFVPSSHTFSAARFCVPSSWRSPIRGGILWLWLALFVSILCYIPLRWPNHSKTNGCNSFSLSFAVIFPWCKCRCEAPVHHTQPGDQMTIGSEKPWDTRFEVRSNTKVINNFGILKTQSATSLVKYLCQHLSFPFHHFLFSNPCQTPH
jgi:hypothetical protein